MGKTQLNDLPWEISGFGGPIAKRAAQSVHDKVGAPHTSKQHFERHVAKRLTFALSRKEKWIADKRKLRRKQVAHLSRERNAVLTSHFHTLFRYRPQFVSELCAPSL
jgi:hypothetical protein